MAARAGESKYIPTHQTPARFVRGSGPGFGAVAVSGDHRSGSGLGLGEVPGIGVANVLRDQNAVQ